MLLLDPADLAEAAARCDPGVRPRKPPLRQVVLEQGEMSADLAIQLAVGPPGPGGIEEAEGESSPVRHVFGSPAGLRPRGARLPAWADDAMPSLECQVQQP